jgi:hypothetical protein
MTPESALLAAAALHLGMQATVTLVTYPALIDVPPERWPAAHAAHVRRITPLVALVYTALLLGVGWTLVTRPLVAASWVAVGAVGGGLALTAAGAGPLHGRLTRQGKRPDLVHRLVVVDRWRLVLAVVAAGAAAAAVWAQAGAR